MPKLNTPNAHISVQAFQTALSALDVVGRWKWDATTNLMTCDAIVALLYNVDPETAAAGAPITDFQAAIHSDDRERVRAHVLRCTWDGSLFFTEYRVTSFDGLTRWLMVSGRFTSNDAGRPLGGCGILVDITQMRMNEDRSGAAETDLTDELLERAVDHAIAAQQVITRLQDPALKSHADALLMELGRRLARLQAERRRRQLN